MRRTLREPINREYYSVAEVFAADRDASDGLDSRWKPARYAGGVPYAHGALRQRTQIKNRIHATLAKYGIRIEDTSDIFNRKGRAMSEATLSDLGPHTRFAARQMLDELDLIQQKIQAFENRMTETFEPSAVVPFLRTMPGIGPILSVVIASEIGDIARFPSAAHLASYAGTTPRVHASGGTYRYGRVPPDVNHYLKWAYGEAANAIVRVRRRLRYRHVVDLYDRIRDRKGHAVAIGTPSRHLAEAPWWILSNQERYREPHSTRTTGSSTKGYARLCHGGSRPPYP